MPHGFLVVVGPAKPLGLGFAGLLWVLSGQRELLGVALPFAVVGLPTRDVHRRLSPVAPDYEHVVIDTPPGELGIARSALMAADVALVAAPPTPIDLDRMIPTLELVADVEDMTGLRLYVLLTRGQAHLPGGPGRARGDAGDGAASVGHGDSGARVLLRGLRTCCRGGGRLRERRQGAARRGCSVVTEKKGGSARRALQRGSRRALPGGEPPAMGSAGRGSARTGREKTKRITVDLPRQSGSRSICPGASTGFLGTSPTTTTRTVCAS
jgi:hypothetical protein